jgi:HB1, ASXL, restriction endonuclease HTH domain
MADDGFDLGWDDAIHRVLAGSLQPMHYADIAEATKTEKLRKSFGATPANTVNAYINSSITKDGERSPYIRVDRGTYWLREKLEQQNRQAGNENGSPEAGEAAGTGLINAFGMYWARDKIDWEFAQPRLLGMQQTGSDLVDFHGQKGVYLLLDGRSVVYVGRTTEQPLGVRLRQHLFDRLNSRWDRFSWFGIYQVNSEGKLVTNVGTNFDVSTLIATMEALLIEGLEPPQNRKRGDDFKAVEFLQGINPDLEKKRQKALIGAMLEKL